MEIKIVEIKAMDDVELPHHLKPTLKFVFELSGVNHQEMILSVYGELLINNTILSRIEIEDYKEISNGNKFNKAEMTHSVILRGYTELSKESLDLIKKSRYRAKNQNVDFNIFFIASVLEKGPEGGIISHYRYSPSLIEYTIPSSDWTHDYAPKLGIGEFLILEVPLKFPESNNKLESNAETELKNALTLISNAEKAFRNMEPDGVIFNCRKAVENLSNFVIQSYKNKNQLTDWQKDTLQKIIRISGKSIRDLDKIKGMHNYKNQKENSNVIEEKDKQGQDTDCEESDIKALSGWLGIFGFLSFMSHDQTQNKGAVHSLIVPDGYDAEAALFFTKVFVKFVAEVLYNDNEKK